MPRLSTRQKRYKNVGSTRQKHRFWKGNVLSRRRFTKEEKARSWAATNGINEQQYELYQHASGKWQWHKR